MPTISASNVKNAFQNHLTELKEFLFNKKCGYQFSVEDGFDLVFELDPEQNEIYICFVGNTSDRYPIGLVDNYNLSRRPHTQLLNLQNKVVEYIWDNYFMDDIHEDEMTFREAVCIFGQVQSVVKLSVTPSKKEYDRYLRGMRHQYIHTEYLNLWPILIR